MVQDVAVKAPGWQTRDADDAGKIYSPSLRICWEKIPNHDGPRLGFAPDSPQEGEGFEPSPCALDSRFSAVVVALGRIKVDSILDHFWTPANTD